MYDTNVDTFYKYIYVLFLSCFETTNCIFTFSSTINVPYLNSKEHQDIFSYTQKFYLTHNILSKKNLSSPIFFSINNMKLFLYNFSYNTHCTHSHFFVVWFWTPYYMQTSQSLETEIITRFHTLLVRT